MQIILCILNAFFKKTEAILQSAKIIFCQEFICVYAKYIPVHRKSEPSKTSGRRGAAQWHFSQEKSSETKKSVLIAIICHSLAYSARQNFKMRIKPRLKAKHTQISISSHIANKIPAWASKIIAIHDCHDYDCRNIKWRSRFFFKAAPYSIVSTFDQRDNDAPPRRQSPRT